jgi:hypothetical protein
LYVIILTKAVTSTQGCQNYTMYIIPLVFKTK